MQKGRLAVPLPSSKKPIPPGAILASVFLAFLLFLIIAGASQSDNQIPRPAKEAAAPNKEVVIANPVVSEPPADNQPQAAPNNKPDGARKGYSSGGKWEAAGIDVSGVRNCAVSAAYGDHSIHVNMVEGNREAIFVYLWKDSWYIEDGKRIDISFTFDGGKLQTSATPGSNPGVIVAVIIGREAVAFLSNFQSRNMMTVRFGDVLEPEWKVPLAGSSQALLGFAACMSQWQRMSR